MDADPKHIEDTDCLIIGGGPAGLTAAIYLARFRRKVIVIDNRKSRAAYIKSSYNYPGFTGGIQGEQLLENLRIQAREYGAVLIEDTVTALEKKPDGNFIAATKEKSFRAKKTLLATGVVDGKPPLPHMAEFIYEGAVRFCPVCDGYEATDKRIGVMGPLDHIIGKALFLSTYSTDLYLLPTDRIDFTAAQIGDLQKAGLVVPTQLVTDVKISEKRDEKVAVILQDGKCIELDVLYPAMGADPRSELAIRIGASHNDQDCLLSDTHQQTSVEGLYVAGDLTTDLSQISVATGQASIAATHMHNTLPRNPRVRS